MTKTSPVTVAMSVAVGLAITAGTLGASGPALAQTGLRPTSSPGRAAAPAAPAPGTAPSPGVPTEPGTTTASYGDWVLRCQRGGSAEKPVRVCEVAQTIQVQGQAAPIAQIAIGRPGTGEPLQVTVVLPPNVAFPSSVRVQADEKDAAGAELPWRRCLPGACVADGAARDDALRRWRTAGEAGRIGYRNAAGQDVVVPLSWRGLPQALDALAKEPA